MTPDKKKSVVAPVQDAAASAPGKRFPLLTAINLLLLAGLLLLYGLWFFGPLSPAEPAERVQAARLAVPGEGSWTVAYVDSDLLMEEYDLAIQMRNDFEAEQHRLENNLNRRQRQFQAEVEQFQKDIATGEVHTDLAQMKERELMMMQQELFELSDAYREQLAVKEFEMNLTLLESITDFLERFNRETNYDFILNYSLGGGVLHAKREHDITREVLRRLNAEYHVTR